MVVIRVCPRRHGGGAAADRSGYGCAVAVGRWRRGSTRGTRDRGGVTVWLGRRCPADGPRNGRSVTVRGGRCRSTDGSVDWVGCVHVCFRSPAMLVERDQGLGVLLYRRTRCSLDSQGGGGSDEGPAGTCCEEIDEIESILILTYLRNLRKSKVPYA